MTATAPAAPSTKAITVATADGICTITLNRPDVLNAFNDQLTTELADALKGAERDAEVRVIVITGAGRAFSSGQDLADLKEKYVPGHVPQLGDGSVAIAEVGPADRVEARVPQPLERVDAEVRNRVARRAPVREQHRSSCITEARDRYVVVARR